MKKLKIITTGGTIDKVYFDARSEYEVGEPAVEHMLREACVGFAFEVLPLMRKDSLEIDDEDRALIRAAATQADCNRVLITHGTDTMVETARALGDIPGKVIVLTGALSPARFRTTDAIFNVALAVGAIQVLESGVYVAMNGCVFPAAHVRKNFELSRFEYVD